MEIIQPRGISTPVKLYVPCIGTNAATAIRDHSQGHKTITVNGNAQLATAQYRFPPSSLALDGVGDYLSLANSADFDPGTGNFTLYAWVRRDGDQTNYNGIICAATSTPVGWALYWLNNYVLWASNASGGWAAEITSNTTIADLTWTLVRIARIGNTIYMYFGDTAVGSWNCTGYNYASSGAGLTVGRLYTNADNYYFKGWLQEVVLIKGFAHTPLLTRRLIQ